MEHATRKACVHLSGSLGVLPRRRGYRNNDPSTQNLKMMEKGGRESGVTAGMVDVSMWPATSIASHIQPHSVGTAEVHTYAFLIGRETELSDLLGLISRDARGRLYTYLL